MQVQKKVVIADDEAPARALLKEYLQGWPMLQLVAECKNGIEALGVIDALQPDLVFMDVQMPGKTGLEVLQEITFIPQIVFSTAYDQYALNAFDMNAVDYLLKPYTRERFDKAVQKILQATAPSLQPLQQLAETLQNKSYPERLLVETGQKLAAIQWNDILLLEAEGDYTRVHTVAKTYLSGRGISALEEKLPPQQFMRIHRSYIIALHAIAEVHRDPSGPQVVLTNGQVVKVSRAYTETFRKMIL